MNRRIRTLIAAPLLVASLAGAGVAMGTSPAAAADNDTTTATRVCTDGTYGKDRWGNIYVCVGGKWVLFSMPALTMRG